MSFSEYENEIKARNTCENVKFGQHRKKNTADRTRKNLI